MEQHPKTGYSFKEPIHYLAVPTLEVQVFERKTRRSPKRTASTLRTSGSFVAKNLHFQGGGR